MISVRARFLSSFKDIIGKEKFILGFEHDVTLKELVDKIDDRSGGNFKKHLMKPGTRRFNEQIMVILKGKDIARRNNLDVLIEDGDEVTFCEISIGG